MGKGMAQATHRPAQHHSHQLDHESEMRPPPEPDVEDYRAAGKLRNRVALITGGDSGIGRAVAIMYAKEGADVAIVYFDEHEEVRETKERIEKLGRRCITIAGDVDDADFCADAVSLAIEEFGKIDILVNNAAEQPPRVSLLEISPEQIERSFRTNIYAYFIMARETLKHLRPGGVIINASSIAADRGSSNLVDYAATRAAVVGFTRSLALSLADKEIRVNGVAPGPIWTPLIPATFEAEKVAQFGSRVPLQRAGQPEEVAPSYVFLASSDSKCLTGQILHPNRGEVVHAIFGAEDGCSWFC